MEAKVTYDRLHLFQFDEENPKEHNIGEIVQSIKRFGFIELPVVNDTTGFLVAGHGRVTALQFMYQDAEELPKYIEVEKDTKEWLVPTLHVTFDTDIEAKAYLIASNTLTIDGGWNEAKLLEMLAEIDAITQNLSGIGFDSDDITDMINNQDDPLTFDDDMGQESNYIKIPVESKEQANNIKKELEELGYTCQIVTKNK
jgi:ParB-like chromosome segregation protein Spo0J